MCKSVDTQPLKVITIFGDNNSGKTTLINYVFTKLMETGGELTYYHIIGADTRDFHAIVIWEGLIIAFCSIGDPADEEIENKWKYIEDGIENAKKFNAEILLNAVSYNIENDMQTTINKYEEILNNEQPFKKIILDKKKDEKIEMIIKKKQNNCKSIIKDLLTISRVN